MSLVLNNKVKNRLLNHLPCSPPLQYTGGVRRPMRPRRGTTGQRHSGEGTFQGFRTGSRYWIWRESPTEPGGQTNQPLRCAGGLDILFFSRWILDAISAQQLFVSEEGGGLLGQSVMLRLEDRRQQGELSLATQSSLTRMYVARRSVAC